MQNRQSHQFIRKRCIKRSVFWIRDYLFVAVRNLYGFRIAGSMANFAIWISTVVLGPVFGVLQFAARVIDRSIGSSRLSGHAPPVLAYSRNQDASRRFLISSRWHDDGALQLSIPNPDEPYSFWSNYQ